MGPWGAPGGDVRRALATFGLVLCVGCTGAAVGGDPDVLGADASGADVRGADVRGADVGLVTRHDADGLGAPGGSDASDGGGARRGGPDAADAVATGYDVDGAAPVDAGIGVGDVLSADGGWVDSEPGDAVGSEVDGTPDVLLDAVASFDGQATDASADGWQPEEGGAIDGAGAVGDGSADANDGGGNAGDVSADGGQDAVPGSDDAADAVATDIVEDTGPAPSTHWCASFADPPWSRKTEAVGGVVSFNEVMYHPASTDASEWIELVNPLTIDVDVSGWALAGGVSYVFPVGTLVPGRGYLVIASSPAAFASEGGPPALGPWSGKLSNGGELLELRNNTGRLMDALAYEDRAPWPVAPDGAGVALAKRDPLTSSWVAESWEGSPEVGGTPGQPNRQEAGPASSFGLVMPLEAAWRYSLSAPSPGWQESGFDDGGWNEGAAVFHGGGETSGVATVRVTADNHFAAYVGGADGSNLRLVGRDVVGDWQSVEAFEAEITADDHLYLAAWEGLGDSGSPQMVVGEVDFGGDVVLVTSPVTFDATLGPAGANPGDALDAMAPSLEEIAAVIGEADVAGGWMVPPVFGELGGPPWGGALVGQLVGPAQTLWVDTFAGASITNELETYALFRSVEPIMKPGGVTSLPLGPTTFYFRGELLVTSEPAQTSMWMRALVDDGAVFSLNGVEVARVNMPDGPVTESTWASASIGKAEPGAPIPLPAELLVPGVNMLAVEVHQAGPDDDDMMFGVEVYADVSLPEGDADGPGLVLSEIGPVTAPWVEVVNAGEAPVDLSDYAMGVSGEMVALPSQVVAPSAYAVVDLAGVPIEVGDTLFLLGPGGADGATIMEGVQARPSPGPGEWFHPDEATPGATNVLVLSDAVVINEIFYHGAALDTPQGPVASEEEWVELLNRSAEPVDVGGWQLVDAIEAQIPPGVTIPPGGYVVVARDPAALKAAHPGIVVVGGFSGRLGNSGETLVLRDACGNPVDRVHYLDGGRWPDLADGGGSSLELRNPWVDNEIPEAWAASSESGAWQVVSWQGVAQASAVGPDGQWQELVLGLLDDGVVLIDDLSVVEDPGGAAVPVVQDDFGAGAGAWRLLGTHRRSAVVPDPDDPSNPVLRLEATGPVGHMHNHAETTLLDGATIQNGQTYAVSMRARWVAGSNRLHARLYFNRLAHTEVLDRPAGGGTPGAPNSTFEAAVGPLFTSFGHAPAVPAPFQPVTVTAVAKDPEGVAGMVVWTSVDGGPFAATPMGFDGEAWSAQLAGLPAGTIVQMYVEAVDGEEATSTFPAAGPASRALWKVDDGLAATNGMHTMRIVMTPQDADWLHADVNLMSDDRVGATVVADEGDVYYDVGVRLKGSERGRPQSLRLGFGVAFGAEHPFRGVYRSVMIDRSEGVGFGQREMLINQAMTHAGCVSGEYNDLVQVLAPRDVHTGPAELQLARFGDLLLDGQFEAGGDGTLFEYELVYFPTTTDDGTPEGLKLPQPDVVMGTPVGDLGDDKEAYRQSYLIDNNRWRDDYARLIEFAKVFGQQGAGFDAEVGSVIDVDEWLRAFAFATLSGCVDNYASGAQHNAQLYVRPSDQRVLYFPHDLDFYAGSPHSPVIGSPDLAKLVSTPQNRRLYYGHLWDITETSYNDAYMAHWRDQIGSLLPGQPFASHHQFIVERAAWVREGAPNSVLAAIPVVPFAVDGASPAGLGSVLVEGRGWVDVRSIRVSGGAELDVAWTDETHWQASAPVPCGASTLFLEARNHQGGLIAGGAIAAWGGDCP